LEANSLFVREGQMSAGRAKGHERDNPVLEPPFEKWPRLEQTGN